MSQPAFDREEMMRSSLKLEWVLLLIALQLTFACSRGPSMEDLEHFRASIVYAQQAIALEPEGTPFGTMDEEDFDRIVDLKRLALVEAEEVDPDELAFLHPEMPNRFRRHYLEGLRKHVEGYDSGDLALMNRGTFLLNDWGAWYSEFQREFVGKAESRASPGPPRNVSEVRDLFEALAEAWNESPAGEADDCVPDRATGRLCTEQFRVEVAPDRLALLRHRRFLEPFDENELAALSRLLEGGWADRDAVCAEPLLGLMEEFGAVVEFHYYAEDLAPLFQHVVGGKECEELEQMR